MEKTFSIVEANNALLFVEPIVKDILKTWSELVGLKKTLEIKIKTGAEVSDPELKELEKSIEKNFQLIEIYMKDLEKVGCIFKDFERGLVDFKSYYKNREVFLCWHPGERGVMNWHFSDTGFEGRKKIDADFLEWNSREPNVEFQAIS